MYLFEAFFACVAAVSSACILQRNEPSQLGGSATRSTTVGWTSTVVLHKCEPALIASSIPGPPYTNWSGLLTQGPACLLHPFVHSRIWAYHPDLVYQCVEPTSAINFEAGNETTKSTEQVPVHGSKFGTFNHRILEARSLARSLGEMVNSGLPFVWVPGELPYLFKIVHPFMSRPKIRLGKQIA